MNQEILERAGSLWEKNEAIAKFSQRYNIFPPRYAIEVVQGLAGLGEQIPEAEVPQNLEELCQAELKRRLGAQANYLDHFLSGKRFTFNDIVSILGIEQPDLARLSGWLDENKEQVAEAAERKFASTTIESYELPVDMADFDKAREAEGVARSEIGKYHVHLGRLMSNLTKAGDYLRDMRAVPTGNERSYFNDRTDKLLIGIPAVCYVVEDDAIRINYKELIRLFGHEGMGHALQKVITHKRKDLPFFLRESTNGTIASEESVTQFYEKTIFDDINNSPDTQKALGIGHVYPQIYQDERDTRLITEYQRILFAYAITVLADTNLGDPKGPEVVEKKVDLIRQRSINPLYASSFVEYHTRQSIDSRGNLDYTLAYELRYSARPVDVALKAFEDKGICYEGENRSLIDFVFLTGYWTPKGFRQKSELTSKGFIPQDWWR